MTIGEGCSGSRVAVSFTALTSFVSAAPLDFGVSGLADGSLTSGLAIGTAASESDSFSGVGADAVSGAGLIFFC